jgi:pilus assembly protein Flp/PilA
VAQRRSRLLAVWRDKSAVTALEYGLIAALIAIVIITALSSVGKALQNVFNNIAGNL